MHRRIKFIGGIKLIKIATIQLNRINYLLLMMLFYALTGCTLNTNTIIQNYELKTNNIKVINVLKHNAFTPFFAADSVVIIDTMYNRFYNKKLEALSRQLAEVSNVYIDAKKELKTIENTLMAKVFSNRIKIIEENKIRIKKIISTYKNNPEKTQLYRFTIQKEYYKKLKNTVLGYSMVATIEGTQGYLSSNQIERIYLFNKQQDRIIGLLD